MKEEISEVIPRWVFSPKRIVKKIGKRNHRTIAYLSGKHEILKGKQRPEIIPILNQMVINNRNRIIINKIIPQRVNKDNT